MSLVHAVQADQFAGEGESEYLLVTVGRGAVGLQCPGTNGKDGMAALAGTKQVLAGLVGQLAVDDLVKGIHFVAVHAAWQAQLGQAAVFAGDMFFSHTQ